MNASDRTPEPDVAVLRLLTRLAIPLPAELEAVRSSPRSAVCRVRLSKPWVGYDRLIAKQIVGNDASARFERERATLQLLSDLPNAPAVAPKLLAWDAASHILLLPDLGDRNLASALLGSDRIAARLALLGYAEALGRLHTSTIGYAATYSSAIATPGNARRLPTDGAGFQQLCAAAGVAVDAAFETDVRQVESALAAPGPFRALTHGDPCPGNERFVHGNVVFIDFEAAGFDHALLDAAYLVTAFPTCWCVGAIPTDLRAEALQTYRKILAIHAPQAADDALFSRHLLHACARWLLTPDALVPRAQRDGSRSLSELMTTDWSWGPATARQRFLYRLKTFIQLASTSSFLPELAATAEHLQRALTTQWSDELQRFPEYPAFK